MQAAIKRHDEVVRLLLDSGAEANAKDEHGRTALVHATDNLVDFEGVRKHLCVICRLCLKADRRGWCFLGTVLWVPVPALILSCLFPTQMIPLLFLAFFFKRLKKRRIMEPDKHPTVEEEPDSRP